MIVLHVLTGFRLAGIEHLALQLLRHWPAEDLHLVLNLDPSHQDLRPAFERLECVSLHQIPSAPSWRLSAQIFRFCRRWHPDALLIYPCNRPMLWVALGARLAAIPRMAMHLGNAAPANTERRVVIHRLLRLFQFLGVTSVPCSQAIVRSLQPLPQGLRLGPVIGNGCDTEAIAAAAHDSRALRPEDDPLRLLMVARLDPIKDQSTLLRAFVACGGPGRGWELSLVGDGKERVRLETMAGALGLDPSRVFLGQRSDVPDLLGRADLFAFSTTDAEGFGIALIEAMAAGLPVIASDVPACREVLRDGAGGELLPPGDVEAWTARLGALLTSAADRRRLARMALSVVPCHDICRTAETWRTFLVA